MFGAENGHAEQLGQWTEDEHWDWVGRRIGLSGDSLARFRRHFFANDALDTDLLAEIDRLRAAGYHLGLLSNAGGGARRIFEQYGVLNHFDSVTISAEEGVMKPDPRIYRIALARAGVAPEEALFVDDVIENVEAARDAGDASDPLPGLRSSPARDHGLGRRPTRMIVRRHGLARTVADPCWPRFERQKRGERMIRSPLFYLSTTDHANSGNPATCGCGWDGVVAPTPAPRSAGYAHA